MPTLVGIDGSSFSTPANANEFNTSGNAISTGGLHSLIGTPGTADTAWVKVGAVGSTNNIKVCLYDPSDNLVGVSSPIAVTGTGLKSAPFPATVISAIGYSLIMIADTSAFTTVYDNGSNNFQDKQWTAAHFSYASPPSSLPAVDANVGHIFILYLTGSTGPSQVMGQACL